MSAAGTEQMQFIERIMNSNMWLHKNINTLDPNEHFHLGELILLLLF